MTTAKRSVFLACGLIFGTVLSGCNDQKTYRDTVNQQNDTFTAARTEELAPAEATYRGTMHLKGGDNESDQDFDCLLEVRQTSEFIRVSQSQDQTETVEVPKLGGSLRFPALEKLQMPELSSFSALTNPMGGYLKVMFDSGNFTPRTKKMVLPYTVPGYNQGALGELRGTLSGGHYRGIWYSKPFGQVGTFDLSQSAGPSAGDGVSPGANLTDGVGNE